MTIRILLADDQPLVREGLSMVLDAQPDMSVVGHASDGQEAIALTHALDPTIVLMDVRMPVVNGIEATKQLTDADMPTRVIVLTTFDLDEYVLDTLASGASGFLLKTVAPQELIDAVRSVANGDAALSPRSTRRLLDHLTATTKQPKLPPETSRLTEREIEVLRCLATGLSNAEIATTLFVSEATVKTHITRLLSKLGLRDRVQAVVYAHRHGFAPSG